VNFHPAPPEWPGRGSASLALFHNETSFGATAHTMAPDVDAGPILAVKRFAILPGESCETVFARAEEACLELFQEVVKQVTDHGCLPPPTGESWRGRPMTRKQFEEWLVLNPADRDTFVRKVRAARHSRFPGPYVVIHGYKFGLVKEAS